jgi:DnaJ-class molecular chaperone
MAKNPYEILGLSKDANEADIKAAYRKLAKKHHPDLNPGNKDAEIKFKELNAANDLLSDPVKRAAFDRGEIDTDGQPQYQQQQQTYRDYADSPQGKRYHSNSGQFDFADFESMFGGMGGRRGGFESPPPNRDVRYIIEVDFLEAARGAKKRITMPDGKTLDINIPEGIEEGQQLRLKGQGQPALANQPAGDAYVEMHIRTHPFFTRSGKDITAEVPITLQESILGGKIKVPTIHGPVEMTIPKGADTGMTLRLKGKGIKGGDQFIKLKLVMPKEIDTELEDAIRKWSETHDYNPRKQMEVAS